MYSVTQRISKIKQPRGGYIKRKDFTCITLEDGIELNSQENIHPSLIGLVIDYMTRFCMGTPKETAFHISILGAKIAKNEFVAYKLLSKINGLDTESIISATQLGIYNPRLNKVYIIKLDAISQSIIDTVSRDVIGYGISSEELKELHTAQLDELKKNFFKTPIQKSSPNANDSDDYLDKKIYGYSSKKNYMSVAFPPKIIDESIYEKEPIFWSGNALPSIITQKNLSYIVRFKACFNLKKGKEPFVMNKTSFLYPFNKALTTSDIYDSKSKKYYSQYLDKNGNIVKSKPTLILTSDDFKLFQELYIVKDLEILDGCYFL